MIERARAAYASQGVTILAVNYEQTDRPALQAFLQRLGTHFDALLDPNGAIAQQYGVDVGLPVTVFIDRSGMVSAIKVGAMTPEYVSTQLRGIL
jgi:peroxiredoxin